MPRLDDVFRQLHGLNEPVPIPLRLPTVDQVNSAESELGVKFPKDYRRFLLEASDVVYGTLEPALVTPDSGYRDLVTLVQAAWNEMDLPKNLLPFCEDNGDYYCLNQAGQVVYWSHNGSMSERWASLAGWIEQVWLENE